MFVWLSCPIAEGRGLYRANVLLGLLDAFHFRQVGDWSSLSNCFLILHLQIGKQEKVLHAEYFPSVYICLTGSPTL